MVADGFDRPNGIAFTKDGKTAYMYVVLSRLQRVAARWLMRTFSFSADTGAAGGFLGNNQTEPATMYVDLTLTPISR